MSASREYFKQEEIKKYGFILPIGNVERTSLRRTLSCMKHRCYNKEDRFFKLYGERGIKICSDWYDERSGKLNYPAFIVWALKSGWKPALQIDRIDNDKGYSPSNCRWITPKENSNNRRSNRILELNGERHTMSEWSEILGMSYKAIEHRVNRGLSDCEALTMKVTKGHERLITFKGETLNVKQWAERAGLKPTAFLKRLKDGWSFEKALNPANGIELLTRRYEYGGRSLTAKEWSSETGIPYATFRRRISKFGFQKAIEMPYSKKNNQNG